MILSFSRIFYFLSKTDTTVIKSCTKETQLTQMSIGMIVLLAGIFAFISGFFALSSLTDNYQIVGLLSLIYAIVIITIDREIVSATDKKAVWLRVPFAVILGLVISYPFEMKVLEDAVLLQSQQNANAKAQAIYKEKIAIVENAKNSRFELVEQQINGLQKSMVLDEESKIYEDKKNGGQGKIWNSNLTAQKDKQEKINELQKQKIQNSYTDAEQKDLEIAREEFNKNTTQYKGFLSRAIALDEITTNKTVGASWYQQNTAWYVALVLKLFFVMLELMGVLIKLFMKYNEYHAYLDCRRALNVQKVNAVGNVFLQEIKDTPVESLKNDYTDMIVAGLEDRCDKENADDVYVVPGAGLKTKS